MLRALILGATHLGCFAVGVWVTCFVIAVGRNNEPPTVPADRLQRSPWFVDLTVTNAHVRDVAGLPPAQRKAEEN